ncbi:MAG: hypothetical protein OXF11_13095 [Deltaproteobacteria bacterium]|nr:hypothetical protein [Deltaproteobacteria bacterium]
MAPQIGGKVWIPCEVKPGPFSNERLARIEHPAGPWLGFVDIGALKEPVETGNTHVLAYVTAIEGNKVSVIVQGHAFDVGQVQALRAKVQPVDPLSP